MGFWSRAFRAGRDDVVPVAAGADTSQEQKQLQAVLVMTRRPLNNSEQLLRQIMDEQIANGYAVAPGFIANACVGDPDDQAYVYASVRSEFEAFGGKDVIDRTTVKTFQASDGNGGSYFMLFNRL
jgi:hypothetical protein